MITIDTLNLNTFNPICSNKFDKFKYDVDDTKYKRAGLILINNDKILIVYGKNSRKWSFPKGRKDNDEECSLFCAIREFEEETGILLHEEELKQIKFFFRTSHCVYYSICVNYDINFVATPKNNHEISKVKYVSLSDLKYMDNLNYDLKMFCKLI